MDYFSYPGLLSSLSGVSIVPGGLDQNDYKGANYSGRHLIIR